MQNHCHNHGTGLSREAHAILQRGIAELLQITKGLRFQPIVSERFPLPLALAVYGEIPDPERVREDVRGRMKTDPLSLLEVGLVLLELYACNQPGTPDSVPDDDAFLTQVFASKRLNGWISFLGDADVKEAQAALNTRWQFKFIGAEERCTGVYSLLNRLARYAFVYGRVPFGDTHLLGHFIEDFTSGLVVCRGKLNDLESTLSLAAMRVGVPAVTPPDYPFQLGRQVHAATLKEVVDAVVAFPSIRRLLDHPDVPPLPDYLNPRGDDVRFEPAATWGDTAESFYLLRKGQVEVSGVEVLGSPSGPMGVLLTVDTEPLDAFDRRYIELRAARVFTKMRGVMAKHASGRLLLGIAPGLNLPPQQIGESLIAAVRNEFPRIAKLRADVIFDRDGLNAMAADVSAERTRREREIESATEESVSEFITCVGCSAFAPDHVCILTPERPPQCGRAYEFIKAGALYGYDDMTNIHHRALHSGINSFGTCAKGDLLDPAAGE